MKIQLDRRWVYAGEFYGPGMVEVPDAVGEALRSRGALDHQYEQGEPDQSPGPDEQPPAPESGESPRKYELFFASLSDEQNDALVEAGYQSNEEVAAASDDDLRAIPRIGRSSIRRIREEADARGRDESS